MLHEHPNLLTFLRESLLIASVLAMSLVADRI